MNLDCAELANRTVAIDLEINGRPIRMYGVAVYETLPTVGEVIRIRIPDPAGEFDVILEPDRWNGVVHADRKSGCDFHISLSEADLCLHA
jgi:hypothetical protein